jgi:hypothetical protein
MLILPASCLWRGRWLRSTGERALAQNGYFSPSGECSFRD